MNVLYHSDCLDILRMLPDGSMDMILQDPPYNMTACKWECELDLPTLWKEWNRVIKDNGATVMTASQPFTSELVMSNKRFFKYEWIWEKTRASNFATVKYRPMKYHENILIFTKGTCPYFPEMQKGEVYSTRIANRGMVGVKNGISSTEITFREDRHPSSIIRYASNYQQDMEHPTQKPVDLFRYLIRTYTNEGETVFDGYGGSGTTAVACIKENRKYIVCEKEAEYIEVAKKRIDEATKQGDLFLSAVGYSPRGL